MEIARRVTAFWAAHCARIDLLFTMSDITRDVRPKPGRADLSFRKRALVAGSNEMASAAKCGSRSMAECRRRLVEPDGIEPTTSCLQSRRSPN